MKNFLKPLFAGAIALLVSASIPAQQWPDRPIKLVVPYTPGGGVDTLARLLADKLAVQLKQTIVVENKPGAGTMLATDYVAKSKNDGYTLLFGTSSALTIVQHTYPKVPYKPEDLQPVGMINTYAWVFTVNPDTVPVSTWKQFIDYARAHPGKIDFGSSGMGTSSHLLFELLKKRENLDMVAIHYKGTALQDLLSGQLGMAMDSPAPLLPHYATGKLRALAVGGTQERIGALPNVPTFTELGIPEMALGAWGGLFAPAGTPRPIVEKISTALAAVVNEADTRARIVALGSSPRSSTPEEFQAKIKEDTALWKAVVDKVQVKIVE